MCLSSVYEIDTGEERLVCENVTAVNTENGVIKFTDIMGKETKIAGILESIDLVKGIIKIKI